jgi:surface antigen
MRNFMRQACLIATAVATLFLAGCAGGSSNRVTSSLGFEPARTAATESTGGLVSQAGVELSRNEIAAALAAEQRALETAQAGQPVEWQGSSAGRGGTVIAAQPYRVGSQDCRPYSHIVKSSGPARSMRGTACRNADGSWTLLN